MLTGFRQVVLLSGFGCEYSINRSEKIPARIDLQAQSKIWRGKFGVLRFCFPGNF